MRMASSKFTTHTMSSNTPNHFSSLWSLWIIVTSKSKRGQLRECAEKHTEKDPSLCITMLLSRSVNRLWRKFMIFEIMNIIPMISIIFLTSKGGTSRSTRWDYMFSNLHSLINMATGDSKEDGFLCKVAGRGLTYMITIFHPINKLLLKFHIFASEDKELLQ